MIRSFIATADGAGFINVPGPGKAILVTPANASPALLSYGAAYDIDNSTAGLSTRNILPYGIKVPLVWRSSLQLSVQIQWLGKPFLVMVATDALEAQEMPDEYLYPYLPLSADTPLVTKVTAPAMGGALGTRNALGAAGDYSRGINVDIELSAQTDANHITVTIVTGNGGSTNAFDVWMGSGPRTIKMKRLPMFGSTDGITLTAKAAGGAGVQYSTMINMYEPGPGD